MMTERPESAQGETITSTAVRSLPDGGIEVDPEAMTVGEPYAFEFGGCSHAAVKRSDGAVDFYQLHASGAALRVGSC